MQDQSNPHPAYAELATTTNFSFLRSGSHPEEFVAHAKQLGHTAIGVADHNTLAGVVRAHLAAKAAGIKLLVGARLIPEDGPHIIAYPQNRTAYGQLSRLLTHGKSKAGKGKCHLKLEEILAATSEHILIVMPPDTPTPEFTAHLTNIAQRHPARTYLAARYAYHGKNRACLAQLADLAAQADARLVAVNDALYHTPARRPLQDIVTCIREGCSIEDAGHHLEPNAERHLKPPAEMARLFRGFEPALARTQEIADACHFSLDDLAYNYPDEPVPTDETPQSQLEKLSWTGATWRYPQGIPKKVTRLIEKELTLIAALDYAPYFLTVHDIVAWARAQGILCQGRGSAANSAVCFCLGVTSVDPDQSSLLFERFLSKERKEPPDIDVDFEHERREEVIQYIYRRYGRARAALTATVITYRPRSAVREVCKALGISPDIAGALAGTVWGSYSANLKAEQLRESGLDPNSPVIRRAITLIRQILGFPRHLSQHVGGFVLTRDPLTQIVPIGNAAMDDRTFIEWDKDDISALNIMKVDVLALGMLTCIRKAFDMLAWHKGIEINLATLPQADKPTYDMLSKGDSLGVFQVESRAQMNMLPRLRPKCFYDLVIQVAIVRPGPIQGNMVHPYLRRRNGQEPVTYPSPAPEYGPADELEQILGRTLGVPLFQEQAMQISLDAACFTPEEANGLRRAMATFRKMGTIGNYEEKMVGRMVARGYEAEFAQRCFDQVKGFGEYGFPESHAASFALLVYVSSWLKCHHPDVFCAALLNAQPLGFYAPAQIVRCAQEHGVEMRPVDVNLSEWDNTLEDKEDGSFAVRLGFRQVDGVREEALNALISARWGGYNTVENIRRRSGIGRDTLEKLAAADAFGSMGLDRRAALWAVRGEAAKSTLPLFALADTAEQGDEADTHLPIMPKSEHVLQDYQTLRLSLKAHPLSFLRDFYRQKRMLTTHEAANAPNGARVQIAGLVLVRQKPGSAKGVCFVTLEDETGIANLVVWPKKFKIYRKTLMQARLLWVRGRVQRAENINHIIAEHICDRTADIDALSEYSQMLAGSDIAALNARKTHRAALDNVLAHADAVRRPVHGPRRKPSIPDVAELRRHPRNVRAIPKSRDFH